MSIYVHERVPSISFDEKAPHKLATLLRRLEIQQGASQLVRYTLPCGFFARWTARQLSELGARASQLEAYVCPPDPSC